MMFQVPFATFIMRNAFEAVPRELDEGPQVDGCSSFAVLGGIDYAALEAGVVVLAAPCMLLS